MKFCHFIVDKPHIKAYVISYFAYAVVPVDVKFKSLVVDLAGVLVGDGACAVFQRGGQ